MFCCCLYFVLCDFLLVCFLYLNKCIVSWMTGWLAGRLFGLVGGLFVCLFDCMFLSFLHPFFVSFLVSLLVLLVCLLVGWLVDWLVGWLVGCRLVGLSTDRFVAGPASSQPCVNVLCCWEIANWAEYLSFISMLTIRTLMSPTVDFLCFISTCIISW